jgi:uncharacterized membrane protein
MEARSCFALPVIAAAPVLPEIEPYKPRVPKTSLSNEAESKLRAALSNVA